MKKTIITIIALILSLQNVNGFNAEKYDFRIPENIEFLEYQVMTNQCDMTSYWCKLAMLNIILVSRGFNSLY